MDQSVVAGGRKQPLGVMWVGALFQRWLRFGDVVTRPSGELAPRIRQLGWLGAIGLMLISILQPAAADIKYSYDEAGRLVQVVAPSGASARYEYDAAGNITAIRRTAAAVLTIAEFSPNAGPVGTTVTITGTGFSTTPAANGVKFNGTTATVTQATATQLVATVPGGATTGPIAVTVGGTTATSSAMFSVTSGPVGPGPVIASFTPTIGPAGTVLTVTGQNFEPVPANNAVRIAGLSAFVTSASATQLQVTVPANALSGRIEVRTRYGTTISAADYFVPPKTVPVAKVGATGRLIPDGASIVLNTQTGGNYGVAVFDGVKGQTLSLAFTGITYTPPGGAITLSVVSPDGTNLLVQALYGSDKVPLPSLPITGPYTVVVSSGSAVVTTIALSSDVTITLTAGGAAAPMVINRPGQNGRAIFDAVAGQDLSVLWSGATFSSSNLYLYRPDGTLIASQSVGTASPNGSIDLRNLQITGTYWVHIRPAITSIGQVNLQLWSDVPGTLTIDGPSVPISTSAGQNAELTFAGTIGQRLGLGVSGITTVPASGSLTVSIYGPDNTTIVHACGIYYATDGAGNCNLPQLPSSGTYTIRLDPAGTNAANMTVTLSSDVAGTLVANAAPVTVATPRAGQNGRYEFDATAGQDVSLLWSGATYPTNTGNFYVYRPDGVQIANGYSGISSTTGVVDLRDLTMTGRYTVLVDPVRASVGQVSLQLFTDLPGSLAIGGAPLPVTLAAGQSGEFSFAGMLGQRLGLGISNLATTPAGRTVTVTVYAPNNYTIVANCGSLGAPGSPCNLPPLPGTGTYFVRVEPYDIYGATLTLTLSADLTGALTPNGPAVQFVTSRVGQDGRYTFDATAGQDGTLMWTGAAFGTGTNDLYVLKPDGTTLGSATIGSGYPSGVLDLRNLPATGTYTVFIDARQNNTGQVTLQLYLDAPGSLVAGGASVPVSLAAGRSGELSFTGNVGDRLGLGFSSLVSTPATDNVTVTVYGLDDSTILKNCLAYSAPGGNCNLPALPGSGTYRIRIDPSGISAANLNVTLSADATGVLLPGGPPGTFTTTRVGQDGRYTFAASAMQNGEIAWSGANFSGTLTIYSPDGSPYTSRSFSAASSSGTVPLSNLPATGNYTVTVDPTGTTTGTISLQWNPSGTTAPAAQTPNGSVVVDGSPVAIAMTAGQKVRYTFSGTAGQRLGLGISGLTTTPSGGTVYVSIYGPDNVAVLPGTCSSMSASAGGGSCNLSALPSTGTYTIRLDPGTAAANLTLTLSSDSSGTLTPNAVATTFSTSRVGQNGRYQFNATAGQKMSLLWSGATFPGSSSYLYVYRPDNVQQASATFSASYPASYVDLGSLPATGTYTVFVDPYQTSVGQINLQLLADAPGSLAIDGSPLPVTLVSGQNGEVTFEGSVGQKLGLGISSLSTTPSGGSVAVTVYAPDNAIVKNCGSLYQSNGGGSCDLTPLPATGTYRIRLDPTGTYATSLSVTLSSDVVAVLTPNAATATTFATSRPGQNARYNFNATMGQDASLVWSNATFSFARLSVYLPDGSPWASSSFGSGQSAGVLDLRNLPATGTYTILIDPDLAATGQVLLRLMADAPGSLGIDGASLPVALAVGQNGEFTFDGTLGQRLGLGVSNLVSQPAGAYVSAIIYAPDGRTQMASCGSYPSPGGSCGLPPLPSTGTYTVRVDTGNAYQVNMDLTLSTEVSGVLVPNAVGATTFATARIGQDGRFTFDAVAGQDMSLFWTGNTLTSAGLGVIKPNGDPLANSSVSSTSPSGVLLMRNLPATGQYAVTIDPYNMSVGQIGLNLRSEASATLVVDGPTVPLPLLAGQSGAVTFDGTLGQKLLLDIGGFATTPTGGWVRVTLYGADRITVAAYCNYNNPYSLSANTCELPPLPSTGQFLLRVEPQPTFGASMNLKLYTRW